MIEVTEQEITDIINRYKSEFNGIGNIEDYYFDDIAEDINDLIVKKFNISGVSSTFVCPNGCGKDGDMGSCMECVGK